MEHTASVFDTLVWIKRSYWWRFIKVQLAD